jgi:hypothetical protein
MLTPPKQSIFRLRSPTEMIAWPWHILDVLRAVVSVLAFGTVEIGFGRYARFVENEPWISFNVPARAGWWWLGCWLRLVDAVISAATITLLESNFCSRYLDWRMVRHDAENEASKSKS